MQTNQLSIDLSFLRREVSIFRLEDNLIFLKDPRVYLNSKTRDLKVIPRSVKFRPLDKNFTPFVFNKNKGPFIEGRDLIERSNREDHLWKSFFWNHFYDCLQNDHPVLVWTTRNIDQNLFFKWIHYLVKKKHLPKFNESILQFESYKEPKEIFEISKSFLRNVVMDVGYNSQYCLRVFESNKKMANDFFKFLGPLKEIFPEFCYQIQAYDYLKFKELPPKNFGRILDSHKRRAPISTIHSQVSLI